MSNPPGSLQAYSGTPLPAGARIGMVYSLWNQHIVLQLLSGCEATLLENGITCMDKIAVPGAFELVFACRRYLETAAEGAGMPEALIALGCVIRGDTPHFEYICQSVVQGLTSLNLAGKVPVIFGVLTADTEQQALERAGGKRGNKGREAALAALQMAALGRNWKP